jgi:hypothetical protein
VVTNLPPDAVAQFKRAAASKTKAEKLKNLKLFLSMIPDHKGTERLRANVKRQISRLEEGLERDKAKRRQARRKRALSLSKGKDEILLLLFYRNIELRCRFLSGLLGSNSTSLLSDTVKPHSIRIGGVNTICLPMNVSLIASPDYQDFVRQADGAIFAISSEEELRDCAAAIASMRRFGVFFISPGSEVRVGKAPSRGVEISGHSAFLSRDEAMAHLRDLGQSGIVAEVGRFSTAYSLDASLANGALELALWLVAPDEVRSDRDDAILLDGSVPAKIMRLSQIEEDPMYLLHEVLAATKSIRVWTKEPGEKEVPADPVLLKEGSTVLDLARSIHGELAAGLRYAVVHRPTERAGSIRVGAGFKLSDGDVVEIH